MTRYRFRTLAALGFLACAGALAFAVVYLQMLRGYQPCAMCIGQRVAMGATGVLFLLAALHAPQRAGRWAYGWAAAAMAVVGGGISARQVWLQSLPPGEAPACGPTPAYLWHMFPADQAIRRIAELVLKGDGDCAKIDAQWLGLALPAWTLIAFAGLAVFALALPALARRAD
jgi:disulfide bond formation protein DsbB